MKFRHLLSTSLALTGFGSLSTSALALQGQPVTNDDRQAGLALREVIEGQSTGLGGAPLITVSGPPGSIYQLFGGASFPVPGGGFDTQTTAPGVLGPVSAPVLALPGNLFVPRSGTFGLVPPSGTQDLDLAFPFPAGLAGLFLDVQVLMQRPGTPLPPLTVSNGQLRQIQFPILSNPFYFDGAQVPSSAGGTVLWADIEQGDVDGDGDNDTIGVGTQGVWLWRTVAGMREAVPTVLWPNNATSAELADFNQDGFLDLAVATGGMQFLRVWLNQGLDAAGNWQGFAEMSDNKTGFPTALGGSFPADIEVGDLDGDGDLDIFLACAFSPTTGMRNRMFFNQLVEIGTSSFIDVTASNLPAILDDSEDCELVDFDLDGDLDIVIANVDGTIPGTRFGEGGDYILVNQGGPMAPDREGFFDAPLPNPIPPSNDESLDVVVGDVDGDGLPDLYFTNWQFTPTPGAPSGTPRPDKLLMRRFDPLTGEPIYVDESFRLAPMATFGTDAEMYDVDFDGDLDIVVGLGTLSGFSGISVPAVQNVSTGILVLENQAGTFIVTTPFIPPSNVADFDLRDIEHGDWREIGSVGGFGRYFELDLGCALTGPMAQLITLDHL
ncbi:MAG: VCBS repeat-containing protein [Planctomycetes bacterium]|nr:VCBS repeat-containing protein [Planctomycetota bacterium]